MIWSIPYQNYFTVCSTLPSFANGNYVVSPQPVDGVIVEGDVLNYTCDENYYFGGSNILTCTSDGTLIGDLGRCYRGEKMFCCRKLLFVFA